MFGYVVIKYKNLLNHCNYKDYSRRIVSVLAVAKGIPFATPIMRRPMQRKYAVKAAHGSRGE